MSFGDVEIGSRGENEGSIEFFGSFEGGSGVVDSAADLTPDFKVDVGSGAFGVTAIANPSDELSGNDSLAVFESGREAVVGRSSTIVGAGGIVVHVIVLGGPAVIAFDGDGVSGISSAGADEDGAIEAGDGGCEFGGHEVLPLVTSLATSA